MAGPLENIARGKSYTLSPAPDYSHCTDPGDLKQLTDGAYTTGHFWIQKSTVGWNNANPAIIILDLGRVEPIRGVSYSTAAGVAGVRWPEAIHLLVSDDGQGYHEAGDLLALSAQHGAPPRNGYATHRFRTDALQTHGRYLAVVVAAVGYGFVDEIEVYRGEEAWLGRTLAGARAADPGKFFAERVVSRCVSRRLREDLEAVREQVGRLDPGAEARQRLNRELYALAGELPALAHWSCPADFKAILPLNDLHARIFQAQAALWREVGLPALSVWRAAAWDPLPLVGLPRNEDKPAIRVDLMQNEYRAAAFNLSSAAGQAGALNVQIEGLPGGGNPDWITVHQVEWTDTRLGQPVAAALPLAPRDGDGFRIALHPGLTRQVWLTLHPKLVAPGTYQGRIRLNTGGAQTEIPLTVKIHPFRFPDAPTLHFGGWDYTDVECNYEINPGNRAPVLTHLREHFVDSPWATAAVLPQGKHGPDGRMTEAPSTAQFDEWLRRWPAARQYCVFVAVGAAFESFRPGQPQFDTAVGDWIRFWAKHAAECGVKPEQLALLLVDEPLSAEQDRIILAWARAVRAAGTGARIWEDPLHEDPTKANQETMAACHVLCPNRCSLLANEAYRNYFTRQRPPGTSLDFYSCSGPVRQLDPYSYHRLQAWTCWMHGAQSTFFWALGDGGGGSSWNEYAARGHAYVPYFLDATSVTPGKHMEAIREGIEDYEYLVMLRGRLARAEGLGRTGPALERARTLLADAPRRVCDAPGAVGMQWLEDKERGLADRVRLEILEIVADLE
jgi:hypothetical protein